MPKIDFRLSTFDIDGYLDFPYGIDIDAMGESIDAEIDNCIGVVRAALKKAKAGV